MLASELLIKIFLSLLLGALVGTQREAMQQRNKIKDFAGFRAFALISLLGFLISFISSEILFNTNLILIGIFCVFFISIFAYVYTAKFEKFKISVTNTISFNLLFLVGIIVNYELYHIAVTLSILITLILFLGNSFHTFAKKLSDVEIYATLKFAIISAIILPLLPNKNYTLLEIPLISHFFLSQTLISKDLLSQIDIFNFYHIWMMVVFISGIGFIGYILMKTIGARKGIILTGFLGGFMSSTALTSTFSIESKKESFLSKSFLVGTVIACSTMFFRIIFEIMVLNPLLLPYISLMLGIMGLVGFSLAVYIFKKSKVEHIKKFELKSPFLFLPALKFAILFLLISFISKLFIILFGESGLMIISFLSGITDVDAITISLSNLSLSGDISQKSAALGILIASFANTLFKAGIAYYLGSKSFYKGIFIIFSIIIFSGIISSFFFL